MKQIRLAIIGCGGFVRSHVKAIANHVPEFQIVALCDVDFSQAENILKMAKRDAERSSREASSSSSFP